MPFEAGVRSYAYAATPPSTLRCHTIPAAPVLTLLRATIHIYDDMLLPLLPLRDAAAAAITAALPLYAAGIAAITNIITAS